MIRTQGQMVVGCLGLLALSVGACSRVPKTAEAGETPPPKKTPPEPQKIMSGCATRFAILAPDKGRPSCALGPQHAAKWRVVPLTPAESQQYRDKDKDKDKGKNKDEPWRTTEKSQPFCVYEWIGARTPMPPDFEALGAEPECALAVAMGTTTGPASQYPELAASFERQARGMSPATSAPMKAALAKIGERGIPTTQVAVVDATPHGLSKPDTSGHGYAVSWAIASTACGEAARSEPCRRVVKPYLAMPLVKNAAGQWVDNTDDGGFIGYFHQLFRAFDNALSDWEKKPNRKPTEHLIINLSLGWDPIKTNPDGLEVTTMKDLLTRAYCDGVLVIAAAGNATGSEGAVLPAALESEEPPSFGQCSALGRTLSPAVAHSRAYRPLIHSVGAVDRYDERLSTSRPWGQPRLAAYGMQVSTETPTGYTTPLSGSSISAAIVSGIAAVIWSARSELTAPDVMALIYESGLVLDATKHPRSRTEFCLAQPRACDAWPVRRASLCGALKKALPAGKFSCHGPLELPALASIPKLPKDTIEPCRVANCGAAVGPMDIQLPEAVLPMPGPASCPACEITFTSVIGRSVLGKASGTAVTIPPHLLGTLVRAYSSASSFQDYNMKTPTAGVPFTTDGMFMATRPTSAEIRWSYNDGISTVVAVTPLGMN